jgi:hypothetical protein
LEALFIAASYWAAAALAVAVSACIARILIRREVVASGMRGSGRRFVWLVTIGIAALSGGLWYDRVAAYYYVAVIEDYKGKEFEPEPQWAEDALVRMGERAITPILTKIGGHRLLYRGTNGLVYPLKRIGEPAHDRLLHAVDSDNNRRHRVGYIIALHEAFQDNSRVHLWIEDVAFIRMVDGRLHDFLRDISPDVPYMFGENGIVSSQFIKWCEKQSRLGRIQKPTFGLLASISK